MYSHLGLDSRSDTIIPGIYEATLNDEDGTNPTSFYIGTML